MAAERETLLTRVVADVAQHGISDRSLRDLAKGAGTSHRMLIYHFGSREGLVAEIVRWVEAAQRATLRDLVARADGVVDLTRALWRQVSAEDMRPFVRLFFESLTYTTGGRDADDRTAPWISQTEAVAAELGVEIDPSTIRLGVAVVRGLLIDVLTTGDTDAATAALERFLAMLEAPSG